MLKSLCLGAVCLISHACTFNSVSNCDVDNNDNNDSDTYLRLDSPRYSSTSNKIGGIYNWQERISFDDELETETFTITFEPNYLEDYAFLVPYHIGASNDIDVYESNFLISLSINYDSSLHKASLDFYHYTYDDSRNHDLFTINNGDYIDDIGSNYNVGYYALIFDIRTSIFLSSNQSSIFDSIFTHDDNSYVTSYSGYYNFVNSASSLGQVAVYGYVSFDNRIFYGFNNISPNLTPSTLYFPYYNLEQKEYVYQTYNLPFNSSEVISQNILFNGVKMSISSYNNLASKGVFSYVRDSSYDDTDFRDLLLTIADVPVYFLTQLLNFELFGFNLFFACASLITLLIMIFVIRKLF